jgi:hypothetical protein
MASVLGHSYETYSRHLPMILLFSISFVIALLIPVFASFPTYGDMGALFLRTSSVFLNIDYINGAIIVFSTLFSILFLSFAIVAICIIVKHSRTYTKIAKEVMDGIEKYTAKVFLVLLLYALIVLVLQIFSYISGIPSAVASLIALAFTPLFFYAPASIVIDDKRVIRSIQASISFFMSRLDYFLLWLAIAIVVLSAFDYVFVSLTSADISRYVMLVFNALFIMPFLVVLQAEMYMRRFKLLKG